jgi:hypothetical protein
MKASTRSLTQEVIVGLSAAVTSGRPDTDVARQFLRDEGLLVPIRLDS